MPAALFETEAAPAYIDAALALTGAQRAQVGYKAAVVFLRELRFPARLGLGRHVI